MKRSNLFIATDGKQVYFVGDAGSSRGFGWGSKVGLDGVGQGVLEQQLHAVGVSMSTGLL